MIDRITQAVVGAYLRNVDVAVAPMTMLIGDIATGKSTFLRFITELEDYDERSIALVTCPEAGVHPARMPELMAELRKRAPQVFVKTHSPYLLDQVDLKTDQVLIFRRMDDGSCIVGEIDKDGSFELWDEDFMLGEVWFNEGENGLLGPEAGRAPKGDSE